MLSTVLRTLYTTAPQGIFLAVTALLVVVVVWRGGVWELLATAALLFDFMAGGLVQDTRNIAGPQYGYLVVDSAFFVVFAVMAMRSRLWWATWLAGFMLFGVFIHLAMIVDAQIVYYAYYLGIGLYTYLMIGAIMVGAFRRGLAPRPLRIPLPAASALRKPREAAGLTGKRE